MTRLWPLLFLFQVALGKPSAGELEFFEKRIRPILAQDCYECHRTGGKTKGGLALDHRAAMKEGGDSDDLFDFANPEESYLIKVLRHEEEEMEMPKDGAKLDDRAIADFVKWIEMGAPDPRDEAPSDEEVAEESDWAHVMERRKQWWSFQPIRDFTPPAGEGSPIDRFLNRKIDEAGLMKSSKAEDRVLVRRLSFTLRGLPPSVDEVNQYLADSRPDRWERLVDQFLKSQTFGERWARHWMDWIRYADSHGSEGDPQIKNSWRYRDYLIRSLNQNVPYNTLVTEHLAGDLLDEPRIQGGRNESALGPAHLRMVFHGFAPTDALDERVRFTDDQINVVTKAFLGLTVSCARCHNHKFDAISQEDYYALFGIFTSTKPGVVRVDAVDEESSRAEMQMLKSEIKKKLIARWIDGDREWVDSFLSSQDKLFENGSKKNELLFLRAWDDIRNDFPKQLAKPSDEPDQVQRSKLENWTANGENMEALSKSGTFTITTEGETLLSGIHPSGLHSHLLSNKDRGIAISPRIELTGDEEAWFRVRGDGRAVARYVVQNYPRNGTVYPSTDLNGGKWRWIRQDLDYWQGDRIHLEVTTAQDQPILAKDNERSWFSLTDAFVVKKNQFNPQDHELKEMKHHLAGVFEEGDDSQKFFERLVEEAILSWKNGTLSDVQATILDELLGAGFLPNETSLANDLLTRYRDLEKSLAVPVRAPGVWEADAHDQEFFERGDHKKPAHLVERRFLEAIDPSVYQSKESGRRELAADFVDSGNPFTARVLVNRVWHHLFGTGLVRTVDNFGRLGEKPSHPELLDYLASEFVKNNWEIKSLIRQIVLTEAWQRSSRPDSLSKQKDPENRDLSYFSLRRLEAEAIRDSLLSVSGVLDGALYGNTVNGNSNRRSIYVRTQRNQLDPFLQTFNAPVPLGGKGRRDETNVPAQSLTMLNSPRVIGLARQWADRMPGKTPEEKISLAYEVAFSRPPESDELTRAGEFLDEIGRARQEQEDERTRVAGEMESAQETLSILKAKALKKIPASETKENAPRPFRYWTFDMAQDQIQGQLHGGAKIENGKLLVGRDGGYFTSAPLEKDLGEKTLQVLVQLDHLKQQGGGALGIETLDGHVFDTIVFAEGIVGQWFPGSEYHRRSSVVGGPLEVEADKQAVWVTITYAKSGEIQIYRNATPYGKSYRQGGLQKFKGGQARVIIGNRHGPPDKGRLLLGQIEEARVYDRALSMEEIGRTLGMQAPPSRWDLLQKLSPGEQEQFARLETLVERLRERESELGKGFSPDLPFASLVHALFNSKEFIYVR